jgi:hypothetical protein
MSKIPPEVLNILGYLGKLDFDLFQHDFSRVVQLPV